MTTAATITANLVLDSRGFQQGVTAAGAATDKLKGKMNTLSGFIQRNAVAIEKVGDVMQTAGKKMTSFITIPILAFFALLLKKALDADTAIGKLANESLQRLNTSLAQLGEKFLPIFIKVVDWLTQMIDKFNNASPAMQNFIFILVALIALAGPLFSFIGTIMSVVTTLSTMGTALSTLTPAVTLFGTTLWTALAPIIPIIVAIIAIVAGLSFVIWAFATDFMGVTTTLKQLFFVIGYEFKRLGEGMKQGWSDAMNWMDKQASKSADTWSRNFEQAGQIIQKVFGMSIEFIAKAYFGFIAGAIAKINEFRNWMASAASYVMNAFSSAFNYIANVAYSVINGIISGINSLIDAINSLGFSLQSLEIPPELTPGSPTPFEMGLRGITKAMDSLSTQSIPQLNSSFAAPNGIATVGAAKTINITDNRRFAAGMDAGMLRTALDDRLDGLTAALGGV